MNEQTLWIVAALSAGTLFGTFWRMRGGFNAVNLRAVGIVLIAALTSILAVGNTETLAAAVGLLGAIAGYLFGSKASAVEEAAASGGSAVDAQNASFGDNAKVAGRDINETVNNIERMLSDVKSLANTTVQNMQVLNDSRKPGLIQKRQDSIRWESEDRTILRRLELTRSVEGDNWVQSWIDFCLSEPSCQAEIRQLVQRNVQQNWQPREISFDNTAKGLYVGITFEREVKIPGLFEDDA